MSKESPRVYHHPTAWDKGGWKKEPDGVTNAREDTMKKDFHDKIDRNLVTYMKWRIDGRK